eukprot:15395946-Alexandrium_andersonii.AAC.1
MTEHSSTLRTTLKRWSQRICIGRSDRGVINSDAKDCGTSVVGSFLGERDNAKRMHCTPKNGPVAWLSLIHI